MDTPLGDLLVVTTARGIYRTEFWSTQAVVQETRRAVGLEPGRKRTDPTAAANSGAALGSPHEVHLDESFEQVHVLEASAQDLGSYPQPGAASLAELRSQVEQWFDGHRQDFDVAPDLTGQHGFRLEIYRVIQEIPFGQTATYGEVAALAGSPRAARAVGTACRDIPVSLFLPVHRVTRADGSTGEASGSDRHRSRLLQHEQAVLGRAVSPWN